MMNRNMTIHNMAAVSCNLKFLQDSICCLFLFQKIIIRIFLFFVSFFCLQKKYRSKVAILFL